MSVASIPIRVAIVGSGPSGFYAAEALLKSEQVFVDMYDRLPTPFGLVRSGVAPDHPKLKEPIRVYQQIAESQRYRFFGNVAIGTDIPVRKLQELYHAVILACGASSDHQLRIPGEGLPGSHAATEFVGWYNGHPDYRDIPFDFSHETAVVIGQGNVAVDVCRILCKTPEELRHTDIAEHALAALSNSKIREVHMIGRRGPMQAKFTHQELRELGHLLNCDPVVMPDELALNDASNSEFSDRRGKACAKNIEILTEFSNRVKRAHARQCHIKFLRTPIEIQGRERVERLVFSRNKLEGKPFSQEARATEVVEDLECGLLLRSVGYCGIPIPGVPFDDKRGTIPHRDGRVVVGDDPVPGLYVTGWIKRGPTGIIGTNRADSVATVASLNADLASVALEAKPDSAGLLEGLLRVQVVNYSDWKKIDVAEVQRGTVSGKPREKFTRIPEMLAICGKSSSAT